MTTHERTKHASIVFTLSPTYSRHLCHKIPKVAYPLPNVLTKNPSELFQVLTYPREMTCPKIAVIKWISVDYVHNCSMIGKYEQYCNWVGFFAIFNTRIILKHLPLQWYWLLLFTFKLIPYIPSTPGISQLHVLQLRRSFFFNNIRRFRLFKTNSALASGLWILSLELRVEVSKGERARLNQFFARLQAAKIEIYATGVHRRYDLNSLLHLKEVYEKCSYVSDWRELKGWYNWSQCASYISFAE